MIAKIEQLIPLAPGWVSASMDDDPILALALVSISDDDGREIGRLVRPILSTLDVSGLPEDIYFSATYGGEVDGPCLGYEITFVGDEAVQENR